MRRTTAWMSKGNFARGSTPICGGRCARSRPAAESRLLSSVGFPDFELINVLWPRLARVVRGMGSIAGPDRRVVQGRADHPRASRHDRAALLADTRLYGVHDAALASRAVATGPAGRRQTSYRAQ